jgi:cleavage and polyadenylation specificity factor subunit 1
MTLFGKDMDELDVVTADFLPDGKRLYILVADGDSNLHVLQYDPEGKGWRFNCDNTKRAR